MSHVRAASGIWSHICKNMSPHLLEEATQRLTEDHKLPQRLRGSMCPGPTALPPRGQGGGVTGVGGGAGSPVMADWILDLQFFCYFFLHLQFHSFIVSKSKINKTLTVWGVRICSPSIYIHLPKWTCTTLNLLLSPLASVFHNLGRKCRILKANSSRSFFR